MYLGSRKELFEWALQAATRESIHEPNFKQFLRHRAKPDRLMSMMMAVDMYGDWSGERPITLCYLPLHATSDEPSEETGASWGVCTDVQDPDQFWNGQVPEIPVVVTERHFHADFPMHEVDEYDEDLPEPFRVWLAAIMIQVIGDRDVQARYNACRSRETLAAIGADLADDMPVALMEVLLKIVAPFLQNWGSIKHPRLFVVSGEPDIGKSLLIYSLWQWIPEFKEYNKSDSFHFSNLCMNYLKDGRAIGIADFQDTMPVFVKLFGGSDKIMTLLDGTSTTWSCVPKGKSDEVRIEVPQDVVVFLTTNNPPNGQQGGFFYAPNPNGDGKICPVALQRRTCVIDCQGSKHNIDFSNASFEGADQARILYGLFEITRGDRIKMTKDRSWGTLCHRVSSADYWHVLRTKGAVEGHGFYVEESVANKWYHTFRMGRHDFPPSLPLPPRLHEPMPGTMCQTCKKRVLDMESYDHDCCADANPKDVMIYEGWSVVESARVE